MISNPKPMASLSSNLLARKGQARPAMRPQGFVGLNPATAQDDLGWNDMGDETLYPVTDAAPVAAPKPVVLRQRDVLGKRFAQAQVGAEAEAEAPVVEVLAQAAPEPVAEPKPKPEPVAALPSDAVAQVAREVSARKTKAAFTLRLDQDRHLRLRLASVVTRRSAQQLVCQALDQFLETLTEVEALARQVGSAKVKG
ncbi:hypothetical protein [Sphingomonas sp. IC-56]|uniref:hypothetical protein n=1 Tax=Sphingomonas sp. IC-56 TaxID=2898529 RepID=UPI0022AB230A|nr:hypothetical protein [Sphingomonas sp. IC-56]